MHHAWLGGMHRKREAGVWYCGPTMRPLTRPARLIAPKQLELDQAYCTKTESEESDLAAMFLRHTLGLQILSRQIRNFKMAHYVLCSSQFLGQHGKRNTLQYSQLCTQLSLDEVARFHYLKIAMSDLYETTRCNGN